MSILLNELQYAVIVTLATSKNLCWLHIQKKVANPINLSLSSLIPASHSLTGLYNLDARQPNTSAHDQGVHTVPKLGWVPWCGWFTSPFHNVKCVKRSSWYQCGWFTGPFHKLRCSNSDWHDRTGGDQRTNSHGMVTSLVDAFQCASHQRGQ